MCTREVFKLCHFKTRSSILRPHTPGLPTTHMMRTCPSLKGRSHNQRERALSPQFPSTYIHVPTYLQTSLPTRNVAWPFGCKSLSILSCRTVRDTMDMRGWRLSGPWPLASMSSHCSSISSSRTTIDAMQHYILAILRCVGRSIHQSA